MHIASVPDGRPPTTVGTPHQGMVPTLAPGEPTDEGASSMAVRVSAHSPAGDTASPDERRKRRRFNQSGPAHAARRAAFMAAKEDDATDAA